MTASDVGESAGIARVTFRVRCESLGYGEAVFLYPDDKSLQVSFCMLHAPRKLHCMSK